MRGKGANGLVVLQPGGWHPDHEATAMILRMRRSAPPAPGRSAKAAPSPATRPARPWRASASEGRPQREPLRPASVRASPMPASASRMTNRRRTTPSPTQQPTIAPETGLSGSSAEGFFARPRHQIQPNTTSQTSRAEQHGAERARAKSTAPSSRRISRGRSVRRKPRREKRGDQARPAWKPRGRDHAGGTAQRRRRDRLDRNKANPRPQRM